MKTSPRTTPPGADFDKRALQAALAPHQAPVLGRSLGQIASTFLPFFAVVAAMYLLRGVSVWLTLALSLPAAGLIVRIFIIQHDCGHGAFFRNRTANMWVGRFCSLFTMTPYAHWRRHHSVHHAEWNNLDLRDRGADIYSTILTVAEYRALPPLRRAGYRVLVHPLVAQVLLPPVVFMLLFRIPFDTPRAWRKEIWSVLLTDLGLAGLFTVLVLLLGAGPVALVQLPTMAMAAILGVSLFSVQHRFEHALWARQADWTPAGAALLGSSYLHLPRVLQWFSGNIGFHHMHHLLPRVPNYRLEACHRACAGMAPAAPPMSFWQAWRAPGYALWDEDKARLVRFADLRAA